MSKRKKQQYQTLKGFKDVLPDDQKYWDFVYERAKQTALDYGFKKIDTPLIEDARVYIKGTGKHSDIVEKELYVFEDKAGNSVALRPEFTPGILRAYIEHGMINQPQPVKLFSYGPLFRHDNPQAGRFRQFYQFDFEVIGSDQPEVDSQLVMMVNGLYKSLGLGVEIEINSIGCSGCRTKYIKELVKYFRKQPKTCATCQERIKKNPLRVLDCKESSCQQAMVEAPQIVDFLCEECKDHFVKVLENLDEVGVVYVLNPKLVRGLDYYNRTVFEVFLNEEAQAILQNENNLPKNNETNDKRIALAGGGRFDGLMEILGGRPTAAVGVAGGVERVITALKQLKIEVRDPAQADVFIAQLGDEAKKKCVRLFEEMRQKGIRVREAFSKNGLKAQLEVANRLNVKYTLILGQKEILDGTIIVRDMESGIQEIIVFDKVIEEVENRLHSMNGMKIYREVQTDSKGESLNEEKVKEDVKEMDKKLIRRVEVLAPADATQDILEEGTPFESVDGEGDDLERQTEELLAINDDDDDYES